MTEAANVLPEFAGEAPGRDTLAKSPFSYFNAVNFAPVSARVFRGSDRESAFP